MNSTFSEISAFATIVLSLGFGLAAPNAIAQPVDNQSIKTEARRLAAVRTLISQETSRRLLPTSDENPSSSSTFCKTMLIDLLQHRGFKAIEPVAVLSVDYPIWNSDLPYTQKRNINRIAIRKLGLTLAKNLQRCSVDGRGDVLKFFGFDSSTGAPPFRLYMLPKHVNPFPESKLVYWSEYVEKTGAGRKGYSWVNLDVCEHSNGISSYSNSTNLKDDFEGQQSSLTIYQGKLVAWDVIRNQSFFAHSIEPNYEIPMKSRISCHWATFPE